MNDINNLDNCGASDSDKPRSEIGEQFKYTYKALSEGERRMVESIRNDYDTTSNIEPKLTRLQSLDKKAKTLPKAVSIAVGIVGILIFGLGMSMALSWNIIGGGIAVSAVGVVVMIIVYPIHKLLVKLSKRKWGDEILSITGELLEEKSNKK